MVYHSWLLQWKRGRQYRYHEDESTTAMNLYPCVEETNELPLGHVFIYSRTSWVSHMTDPSILLVEDSTFMASRVAQTLEEGHNMSVTRVADASEATEALTKASYDCIVTNQELPDKTGIELAASISHHKIPILLLTGRPVEPLAPEALEAGITEFVSKDNHATGSMDVLANRIRLVVQAADND